MTVVPVIEIGGSHATAALVDPVGGAVHRIHRGPLTDSADAETLLTSIADVASRIDGPAEVVWGVAIPGPFDYPAGIGRFTNVGKFEALNGIHIGQRLRHLITPHPAALRFLNDAMAFGLGEWHWGAAREHDRVAGITLGTGVGSTFLHAGRAVTTGPDVPPEGRADLLTIAGKPLEDTMSTRALTAAHRRAGGRPDAGVAEITALAADGDRIARAVVDHACRSLGSALAPWLSRFEATVLVVGGGISAAWPVIEPPLREGLASVPGLALVRSEDTEASALRGAALHAAAPISSGRAPGHPHAAW